MTLGQHGESIACQYLIDQGYVILERNWRLGRTGEIDIIACLPSQRLLAFVEVKTRRSKAYGDAIEAVKLTKQNTIRALAEAYLSLNAQEGSYEHVSFDVITVQSHLQGEFDVRHYPTAF